MPWIKTVTYERCQPIPDDAASCEIPGGIAYAWSENQGWSLYRERLENGDCDE